MIDEINEKGEVISKWRWEFGILRIPGDIQKKYNVNEWQSRAAWRIFYEEALSYIFANDYMLKAYLKAMGKRWCHNDPNWGDDTYSIIKNGVKK